MGRIAIFLLLLPSLTMAQVEEGETYLNPETGLKFPCLIGDLVRSEIYTYPQKSLGVSIHYQAGSLTVTAYVYPASGVSAPPLKGELSPALRKHYEQVKGDLYRAQKLGYYKSVSFVSETRIQAVPEKNGPIALKALFTIDSEYDSELYLFVFQENYVKIRATYAVRK